MRLTILATILLGGLSGCAVGLDGTPASANATPDAPIATAPTAGVDVTKTLTQADLAYQRGDLNTAEKGYRLALAQAPNNATAQYQLGNTLARAHRYDEAITVYKAALAQDAAKEQAYTNLATIYMLQAQAILSSGVDHLPAADGNTAQVKHMLWQLKRITPEQLQVVGLQRQVITKQ